MSNSANALFEQLRLERSERLREELELEEREERILEEKQLRRLEEIEQLRDRLSLLQGESIQDELSLFNEELLRLKDLEGEHNFQRQQEQNLLELTRRMRDQKLHKLVHPREVLRLKQNREKQRREREQRLEKRERVRNQLREQQQKERDHNQQLLQVRKQLKQQRIREKEYLKQEREEQEQQEQRREEQRLRSQSKGISALEKELLYKPKRIGGKRRHTTKRRSYNCKNKRIKKRKTRRFKCAKV